MRLLLTADLRYRLSWFKWVETQAGQYDAITIAGDLLDVFNKESLPRQIKQATNWLRSLATKRKVILCSGNHDTIDIPTGTPPCPMPGWLAKLASIITVDGKTAVIRDKVIITSLSYIGTASQKQPVLEAAYQLREQKRLPWIVLHHHPPSFHEGIGQEELIAGRLLKEFSPTFWVSGRIWGQEPFLKKRGWIQRIGNSIVLNTPQLCGGQNLLGAPFPNHVVLDLPTCQLTWHSAFQANADQEQFDLA